MVDRSSEAGSQGDTTVTDMATSEMNVVTKRSGFVSEDELLPTNHIQSGGGGSSNSNSIHGRGDISSSVARVDCVFPSPQCDPLLPWRKAFHLMKASPNLSLLMGSNPLSRTLPQMPDGSPAPLYPIRQTLSWKDVQAHGGQVTGVLSTSNCNTEAASTLLLLLLLFDKNGVELGQCAISLSSLFWGVLSSRGCGGEEGAATAFERIEAPLYSGGCKIGVLTGVFSLVDSLHTS